MDKEKLAQHARLLGLMLCAEVKRRGGKVSIPREAIAQLIKRSYVSVHVGDTLEFTLGEPNGKLRDAMSYPSREYYRLEVALKYLIDTSPGKKLVFTDKDLHYPAGHMPTLTLEPTSAGLEVVLNSQSREVTEGSVTYVLSQTETIKHDWANTDLTWQSHRFEKTN